jgi:hypothetical protein
MNVASFVEIAVLKFWDVVYKARGVVEELPI